MKSEKAHRSEQSDRLWQFFLLTFLFSWLMWLPGILLTYELVGSGSTISALDDAGKWIGGLGPSLIAVILTFKINGRSGVKHLLRRALNFRLGRWHAPTWLLIPVLLGVGHLLNSVLFGASGPQSGLLREPWWIPVVFLLFFVLQIGEELGWRGFALDRLQKRWSALTASIVVGCTWVAWHLPMFLAEGFGHHDNQLPIVQFAITLVTVSILMTWLQNNVGGSLIPAFVLHTYINLSSEVIPMIDKTNETQNDATAWTIANVVLVLVACTIVVSFGRRRLVRDQDR